MGGIDAEGVSPSITFLTPPEPLVLEVKTSGGFHYIEWTRNNVTAGQPGFSPVLAHFGEIYVDNATTAVSLGRYDVNLVPVTEDLNIGMLIPTALPPTISFVVLSTGLEL